MDTRLKNNSQGKIIGILISLLLLSALAVGVIATYPILLKNADTLTQRMEEQDKQSLQEQDESYRSEFINLLYRSNYSLYQDIMRQGSNVNMTPSQIFLSGEMNSLQQETAMEDDNAEIIDDSQYEEFSGKTDFVEAFNDLMNNWQNTFYNETIGVYNLEYYIIDNATGKVLTNTINPLNSLLDSSTDAQNLKDIYPFYAVFKYGEDGSVEIPDLYGMEESWKDTYKTLELTKKLIMDDIYSDSYYQYTNQIKSPKDVTIIYAIKSAAFYYPEGINNNTRWQKEWTFNNGGFQYIFFFSILIATLLALLLPLKKSFELGKGFIATIPFEITLLGICFPFGLYDDLLSMALETATGSFLDFSDYSIMNERVQKLLDYGCNFIVWLLVLLVWFMTILSLRTIFSLGLNRYLKEKTITGRLIVWFFHKTKKFLASLSEIDLTDPSNKAIFKILGVNFGILVLLCSIWLFGVFGLIIYTVILFFTIKKFLSDIKKKYGILLDATSNMAEGNLEISIEEDLGVFNPLKGELAKVQYGFKKAVEEEMKSQKMKTELITNVSHDLKTPLTAIITYINLLKDGNITEEERNSYIDTIDKKSMRLKSLIEDLFEISKASSNNITLNLVEMDLISLIKQVQLELTDKIEQSEVEFRYQLPEEKVILNLDSEKTYRIFENLILNITKYAMPHSRAYIDVSLDNNDVTVTLKNVSATELNFTGDEISERFVRGDKSRNTEGSGLGLAIVKNFVELQGGKFGIILDGDLFKAVIVWKRMI